MSSEKYLQIIEILSDVIVEDKKELKRLKDKIESIEQHINYYVKEGEQC